MTAGTTGLFFLLDEGRGIWRFEGKRELNKILSSKKKGPVRLSSQIMLKVQNSSLMLDSSSNLLDGIQ